LIGRGHRGESRVSRLVERVVGYLEISDLIVNDRQSKVVNSIDRG
jgi:hypothetical protein